MFSTWGSVWTLFAKGGEHFWPDNFINFGGDGGAVAAPVEGLLPATTTTRGDGGALVVADEDLGAIIEEFG